MLNHIRQAVLPSSQRRTLEELTKDLDLRAGDKSQRSAFWTMLVLSGVIASAGVLNDSTATVIGAMIIAPLSTPIMGMALGVVKRTRTGSGVFVLAGAASIIAIGLLFSMFLPGTYDLTANSQVTGRTAPNLLDGVAAMATGFAGSVALARRDVAAVLPGVAIAISLVPPLAVVGVCFGQGELQLGMGALWLFLSNLLSLVLTGMLVFTVLGYGPTMTAMSAKRSTRRSRVLLVLLVLAVATPLALNTLANVLVARWQNATHNSTTSWLAASPGAEVSTVDVKGTSIVINIRAPGELPDTRALLADLSERLPPGITIELATTVGEPIEIGTTE